MFVSVWDLAGAKLRESLVKVCKLWRSVEGLDQRVVAAAEEYLSVPAPAIPELAQATGLPLSVFHGTAYQAAPGYSTHVTHQPGYTQPVLLQSVGCSLVPLQAYPPPPPVSSSAWPHLHSQIQVSQVIAPPSPSPPEFKVIYGGLSRDLACATVQPVRLPVINGVANHRWPVPVCSVGPSLR
jgi:hypothetical protein